MMTGKTIALTRWTFVGKVMSLLFNRLSRLVITFLPRITLLKVTIYICIYVRMYIGKIEDHDIHFNSVAQSFPTLCNPMDCSTPGFPVHHQLQEFTQTHVHWVGDAIQPSHPLLAPFPPAFNLSQHRGLFQWVSSSHHVAKVLEFQLQHQSFQGTLKTDFL